MSSVLVFAAHPDDEVLGVGGTVERHRAQGDHVTVVVAYRCRTQAMSGAVWWKLDPGDPEVQAKAEMAVYFISPDIVYTHHGGDINADHRALHEAVMVACRPYAAPSVKSIRTFHTPSSTEWGHGFTPTLYVDISDHIDAKLAAMALYESELRPEPHPRSLEYLKAQAMTWGAASGFRFAEAFQVERERW
jgi:LmbE family N-acetylglucosaminyl deacetylase